MSRIVDLWAQDWFAKAPWQTLGGWDEAIASSADPYVPLCRAGSMEIGGKRGAKLALGLAIMGSEQHSPKSSQDEGFLRDLGARAIDDLGKRVSEIATDLPAKAAEPAWNTFPRIFSLLVGTVGQARIAIECPLGDLVTMTRTTYPAQTELEPLATPAAARDQVGVKIGAQLGTTSISLRELAGLEAGDLLLLDSKPGDHAKLMIEDCPTNLTFSIRSEGQQRLLEFQETL